MDVNELYSEYMQTYPHMPVCKEVVRDYLGTHKNPSVHMLYDWVGSQGLYEEGAEEEW